MPASNNNKPVRSPLQLAYDDAWNRRDSLESAQARERREALAEFTSSLDTRLRMKYAEQIRAAREEEARAHAALMQEREMEALKRRYPYPLGTVMVEWGYPSRLYRAALPSDRRWTGRRGVLEVITAESEHPANWSSWKVAGRGELVIRLLKKDGSKSKEYVKPGPWDRDHWVPEGTDLMQADLSWPEVGADEQAEFKAGQAAVACGNVYARIDEDLSDTQLAAERGYEGDV